MTTKKVSPRKLEANRRNAQKSTGPKTAQGKARSSRNAMKHGLLACHLILHDDLYEDPAEFDQLFDELVAGFAPQTPAERLLVERIAACYWRLRRALRFETQAVAKLRQGPQEPAPHAFRMLPDPGQEKNGTDQTVPQESNMGPEGPPCELGQAVDP